jgi:hypothetical protein
MFNRKLTIDLRGVGNDILTRTGGSGPTLTIRFVEDISWQSRGKFRYMKPYLKL